MLSFDVVANKFGVYAAEAVEDDLVEVDSDEGAVTGEDAEADDESDNGSSSTSPMQTPIYYLQSHYTRLVNRWICPEASLLSS